MYCHAYGSKFVSIETQKENTFLVNYLKSIDSMYANCEYMYNLKNKIKLISVKETRFPFENCFKLTLFVRRTDCKNQFLSFRPVSFGTVLDRRK